MLKNRVNHVPAVIVLPALNRQHRLSIRSIVVSSQNGNNNEGVGESKEEGEGRSAALVPTPAMRFLFRLKYVYYRVN